MARTNLPLLPFPDDIDRRDFGHYVSGFTDGEGSFQLLRQNHPHGKSAPQARFAIQLRADDLPILRLIQSFFACGRLTIKKGSLSPPIDNKKQESVRYADWRAHRRAAFEVARFADIFSIIMPHFDRFPLRAKKARDFQIWKEGVLLMQEARIITKHGPSRKIRWRWSAARLAHFVALHDTLKANRLFNAPHVQLPPRVRLSEPTLFDTLD